MFSRMMFTYYYCILFFFYQFHFVLLYCNKFADFGLIAVNKEQINKAPQVDDNNFPDFQMPDVLLDSYLDGACLNGFSSDGITVFDDSCNYNTLSDLEFVGTNSIHDLPTLDDTIAAEEYHYEGSCEEFLQMPDPSWFHSMCHQAKPFSEEPDIFDSERSDYSDPETFIKNFLAISDESNSLPALVSKETSKRKPITLVLDLDGNFLSSLTI